MGGYPEVRLSELCELAAGPSGSLLENLQEGSEGVPVIAPPDFTGRWGIEPRRLRRLAFPDAGKLSRFAVREGDLLMVRQGTLGRLALVKAEHTAWLFSSACLRIRVRNEHVLPAYLASYLTYQPVQKTILDKALPGTVPSFNAETLRDLPVAVPPTEHQRMIIDTTAEIAAQASIQREIADRLEILGQAIFGDLIQERTRA